MTIIQLDKTRIHKMDLSTLQSFTLWHVKNSDFFLKDEGQEIYKLLAYLSTVVEGDKIIDIGTSFGFSALALSYNDDKKIVTYDIHDHIPDENLTIKNKTNIEVRVTDILEDIEDLTNCNLICLDIDHSGYYERKIFELLIRLKFKGILVVDNIKFLPEMKTFWEEIKLKKIDVTPLGHWTATGLVIFDPSTIDIEFVEA